MKHGPMTKQAISYSSPRSMADCDRELNGIIRCIDVLMEHDECVPESVKKHMAELMEDRERIFRDTQSRYQDFLDRE